MPASYEIDANRGWIRVVYTGPHKAEDVRQVMENLAEDPRVEPGMQMLSDHSRTTTPATPDLVVRVMPSLGRLAERLGPLRVAMVTPRDAQVGMAHMAVVHARPHGVEIRPFRSLEEAEAWLREGAEG